MSSAALYHQGRSVPFKAMAGDLRPRTITSSNYGNPYLTKVDNKMEPINAPQDIPLSDPIVAVPPPVQRDWSETKPINTMDTRADFNDSFKFMGISIPNSTAHPGRRTHNVTPEFMARQRRVRERTVVDHITGQKMDYYSQLPPEANADYREAPHTYKHSNRRLIDLNGGYDINAPIHRRRERYADKPQPDGQFFMQAISNRLRSDAAERAAVATSQVRHDERPMYMWEKKRPHGYVGYQNMARHIPYIPGTQRANTKTLFNDVNSEAVNPHPEREPEVVWGEHRVNKRRPNPYANFRETQPAEATEPAHAVISSNSDLPESKRSTYEHRGYNPGHSGSENPTIPLVLQKAEREPLRRKQINPFIPTDYGVRAVTAEAPPTQGYHEMKYRPGAEMPGAVKYGNPQLQAGDTGGTLVHGRHQETLNKRADLKTMVARDSMTGRGYEEAPLVVGGHVTQDAPKRNMLPTNISLDRPYTFTGHDAPPKLLNRESDLLETKRDGQKTQWQHGAGDEAAMTILGQQSDLQVRDETKNRPGPAFSFEAQAHLGGAHSKWSERDALFAAAQNAKRLVGQNNNPKVSNFHTKMHGDRFSVKSEFDRFAYMNQPLASR